MNFFTFEMKDIFKKTSVFAIKNKHKNITISHLLLESLNSLSVSEVLTDLGVDIKSLKLMLKSEINSIPQVQDLKLINQTETVKELLKQCSKEYEQRVAFAKAKNKNADLAKIDEIVFVNILFIPDQYGRHEEYHIIQKMALDSSPFDVFTDFASELAILCGERISDKFEIKVDDAREEELTSPSKTLPDNSGKSALETYTLNLNKEYAIGNIDSDIIGREEITDQVVRILCRKKKSSPVLIGESGVGKTSVVELLASLIVENKVPKSLKGKIIYSLNVSTLVAGTKYRGDFEARVAALLSEIKEDKNAILFIDEIHMIMGAGATGSGTGMDMANLLKNDLSSGNIKMIGTTTHDDYKKYILKDVAFSGRLQSVFVKEPSKKDMFYIIEKCKEKYENHHDVTYSDEAIKQIIELSDRYIHDQNFPDKDIDLLDESGSLYSSNLKKGKRVVEADIIEVISKKANIKLSTHKNEIKLLRNLRKTMQGKIFGQDLAIDKLVKSVYVAKANLQNRDKPFASFLFVGPTGVGKTEVVKELAKNLKMKLHRIDMSEYMDKSSVSKLIGTTSGFVGFEEGGKLTELVKKEPYSIVLLDEIEKAHPSIPDILLQILDNGMIADGSGHNVSFRNTIIVMTTNAGASLMEKESMGFNTSKDSIDEDFKIDLEAIKVLFKPELRNRLSAIVPFNYLNKEAIKLVVKKNIKDFEYILKEKNLKINVTSTALSWFAKNGYDKKMGARPMERVINTKIKEPLSEKILFDEIETDTIKIGVKNDDIVIY